MTNHFR